MTRFDAHVPGGGFACELAPNRSASWRQTRCCILVVAIVSALNAAYFAVLGAWPVAPFAALEVAAFAAGLYACARASYRCEQIRVDGADVVVARGVGTPREWARYPRAFARVRYERASRLGRGRLCIGASGRYVEVGSFLNEPERRDLADRLAGSLQAGAAY